MSGRASGELKAETLDVVVVVVRFGRIPDQVGSSRASGKPLCPICWRPSSSRSRIRIRSDLSKVFFSPRRQSPVGSRQSGRSRCKQIEFVARALRAGRRLRSRRSEREFATVPPTRLVVGRISAANDGSARLGSSHDVAVEIDHRSAAIARAGRIGAETRVG